MMTRSEHYRRADSLLAQAAERIGGDMKATTLESLQTLALLAQAHATLATASNHAALGIEYRGDSAP